MNPQEDLISFAREAIGLSPSEPAELVPFPGRGSDRAYFRLKWRHGSVILAHYDPKRIENSYFAGIAVFLLENGVPVPKILRHDVAGGRVVMEDLGDTDLWSLRGAPWERRRILYRKTLAAAHRLHSIPEDGRLPDRVRLAEPFGPALYRWERTYFRENFVSALCGLPLDSRRAEALEDELESLASRLSAGGRCLVHRDLQSQNVMVPDGEPRLIDFQGMRTGSRFYDLGSLLCDPYVSFADAERMELLSYYFGLSPGESAREDFQTAFWEASAQRLMQALGAYGFLGLRRGLAGYLRHVLPGLGNLDRACENARSLPLLLELCRECAKTLTEKWRGMEK